MCNNNPVRKILTFLFPITILWFLSACAPQPPLPSPGHINTQDVSTPNKEDIPPPVQQSAYVPPPQPMPPLETFSVSVVETPAKEILFALARDAGMDLDISVDINEKVTLNAIQKTLPQIMERIAVQTGLLYKIEGKNLIVTPDVPYLQLYKVNYVNMLRESSGEVEISTQIVSTGTVEVGQGSSSQAGGNNSRTRVANKSDNRFWETLKNNILAILANSQANQGNENNVILNPESGVISVRATQKQHQEIQRFLDQVLTSAQRQVLIEATVTEVMLSDQYQAGIDWRRVAGDYSYIQSITGGNLGESPVYSIGYTNPDSKFGDISATVRLLEQFGTVKVLSSPKVIALNNQTAILKVVDNIVYFTSEVQISETDTRARETYTTEINTIPVGLVMNVTPQISDTDEVILNIRPTISRIIGFKEDPNPDLAVAGVTSRIPETQVREMETVLKVNNGAVAIIGGLMQDSINQGRQGVPWLSTLPLVGDLFSYRADNYVKTELIIFLKPSVIRNANVNDELRNFKTYLPEVTRPERSSPTGIMP